MCWIAKDLVGYGIFIDPKNNIAKLVPAKYTCNLKSGLSAINVLGLHKDLSAEQLDYLEVYTKEPSAINKNKFFRELKYLDFEEGNKLTVDKAITLTDKDYTTYFTKKDNWLYAISLHKSTSEMVLYKFDTKAISGDDYFLIQMERNRKVKWAEESRLRDVIRFTTMFG